MLSIGLSLTSVAVRGGGGVAPVSGAALMLASETQGLGLDFTDTFFRDLSGLYGSARVKDTSTPANNYNSHPFGLVSYAGASPKLCRGPDGKLRYGAHNLYLNSESPANQNVTVISGLTYEISVTGTVSITLSGAATGTVTAGNPISFTAGSGTLTCGSTSGSGTVHLRRTPSDTTYLKTTDSARYELPYEWDENGDLLGIRHEPQRTNLLTYSEQFDNAAWTKTNCTVSADQVVAPDGATTADTVTATYTATAGAQQNFSATAAAYTRSIFAKAGTATWLRLAVDDVTAGSNILNAWFDLANGEVGTVDAGLTASIEAYGNSWYRCSVTRMQTVVKDLMFFQRLADGDNSMNVVDGTTLHYWGAQVEAGSLPTSYIPTVDSTVTRAADVLGPALTAFPWNSGTGTYEVDGVSETPTDNGTILTLAPRSGQTHIQTVKWVPSP